MDMAHYAQPIISTKGGQVTVLATNIPEDLGKCPPTQKLTSCIATEDNQEDHDAMAAMRTMSASKDANAALGSTITAMASKGGDAPPPGKNNPGDGGCCTIF